MKTAKTLEELIVWHKAHQLVLEIYRLSKTFPRDELYGLDSQIRRVAVYIPANVTESFKKRTYRDKLRFFNIAQGSLEEVRYYLILCTDLKYCDTAELGHDLVEINRILEAYMTSIRKDEE